MVMQRIVHIDIIQSRRLQDVIVCNKAYFIYSILPMLFLPSPLPEQRQMKGQIDQIRILHRIGRIGQIVLVELVISVFQKQVRNALPFRIQPVDIQHHSLGQQCPGGVFLHIAPDQGIRNVITDITYNIRFARMYLIHQFHLFFLHVAKGLDCSTQIPHIPHGLGHLIAGAGSFLLLIDDRCIA